MKILAYVIILTPALAPITAAFILLPKEIPLTAFGIIIGLPLFASAFQWALDKVGA